MQAFATASDNLHPFASSMEQMQLVESQSMRMSNDPRFFQDNVLDKRLAAFSGLATVSSLMVGTCMGEVFGMDKNFDLTSPDGYIQMVGFFFLTIVLVVNILATYVGVVQCYHTMRLMTSGATGFEMAAGYYLNKNIAFYRHFSIKAMLVGLPILLISTGLRLLHKFDTDQVESGPELVSFNKTEPSLDPVAHPNIQGLTLSGLFVCVLYLLAGCTLYRIHTRHVGVFREKYEALVGNVPHLHQSMLLQPAKARLPDV
eukprot:TRINITY_DN32698_c0_g1_i1.p1 TRINITY_DN32698_c0_g1~~TRINITY_DN32698_c0_g1_i1.p1  ORF type:complete len:258 (+),score=64.33 TRINITY_DN32698_c0_g1_i1:187-960(+)